VAELGQLAAQCLQDLAARLKNLSISAFVGIVLQNFEERVVWTDSPAFALSVLQAIAHSVNVRNSALLYLAVFGLLDSPRQTLAKRAIISAAMAIVPDNPPTVLADLVIPLVKHLVVSVRSLPPPSPEGTAPSALEVAERDLQGDLTKCVGVLSRKVASTSHKIEALESILALLTEETARITAASIAPEGAAATPTQQQQVSAIVNELRGRVVHSVLGAGLEIVTELSQQPQSARRTLSERAMTCLVDLLRHENADVRLRTIQLLLPLLADGPADPIINFLSDKQTDVGSASVITEAPSAESTIVRYGERVRAAVLESICMRGNTPDHLYLCWEVFVVLLARLRHRDIVHSVPMIFELQTRAAKKATSATRSLHVVVAAFIRAVGRIYGKQSLRDYVKSLTDKRKSAKQNSPYLALKAGTLTIKKGGQFKKSKVTMDAVTILFDREKVVDSLCRVQILVQEYGNLRALLSADWAGSSASLGTSTLATSTIAAAAVAAAAAAAAAKVEDDPSRKVIYVSPVETVPSSVKHEITYKEISEVLCGEEPPKSISFGVTSMPKAFQSFSRMAATCSDYSNQSRAEFDKVMAHIPKPSSAKTDLLGTCAPADLSVLEPEAHTDYDWTSFVQSRQHWPTLFELNEPILH
jgi:hypothetical protein